MDLLNWEFFIDSGNPVVGATVKVRDAVLSHPNTGTVVATTSTDSNGMWTFTGLSATAKDVEVIWGASGQYHKWYKGMTQHVVAAIFFDTGARFKQQGSPLAAPGVAGETLLWVDANGVLKKRSGVAGAISTLLDTETGARKNLVINGSMSVVQRISRDTAVTSVDNTYQVADRWKSLWAGGTAWNIYDFTIGSTTGTSPFFTLLQSAGNSSKVGMLYILENLDTIPLRSLAVSLQSVLASAASIGDIRWALLSWSGTADAPTDPVSSWNADGTNPTLAANWAYINTPANLGVSNVPTRITLENQVVPTTANNLAIMLWCEDSVNAAGNSWYFTDVQLEIGPTSTSYERHSFVEDLLLCQRYFQKTYNQGVAPGTNTAVGELIGQAGAALAASTAGGVLLLLANNGSLLVPMRATPTAVIYSIAGVANAITVAGAATRTGVTAGTPSARSFFDFLNIDATSATAIADRNQIQLQATASAEL